MVELQIPQEYVELCEHWHSGQSDLLYAVSSTGNLTLGNRRPLGCETDEQWHLQLFRELSCDIRHAKHAANKMATRADMSRDDTDDDDNGYHDDAIELAEFEKWCDGAIAKLESTYGLADWECN